MTISAQDAHPWPIYNARFRAVFPILDADGDLVTAAATPDSEISVDMGTFADATNEAVEIATSSGIYYLDLINTNTAGKSTVAIIKTATAGAKTTVLTLNPLRLPIVRTGTAQAGAASTITLDSGASTLDDFYNGLYVNCTNNSPANVQGQARQIIDYVGSTRVATIEGTWGTNVSSATTFELLVPPGYYNPLWHGTLGTNATALADLQARTPATLVSGRMDASIGAAQANVFTASSLATDAVTEIQSGLSTLTAGQVNAEVVDALNTDTYAEPGQGAPGTTISLAQKIGFLYKAWRNRHTQDATTYRLYADNATTVDHVAAVSDSAGTTDVGEVATGP